ncbi:MULTISPECIES: YerC/YecD family TrpR-related protein [unclassified Dehalobacter]|uniref:YerC/YecD family TrpR-related protein n=1 Tax=unclassified Dehalobacter TaxID=2635733 RepID=UPI00036D4209|nr:MULTISPECIES: YerC/YecD family TrpR-related protein [unclassified Dehalobacter]RJE49017.1 TrpR-like protein YerC/YecD [Dehalobacter sp. MCB1]TCX51757.1 TrpR-like protein YerC/YecD [Dehalobacter sp. 14DCB1]TCX52817.1 TrpR-like protein YerC/YecD [Dehalobacter sp. 12DCB1]
MLSDERIRDTLTDSLIEAILLLKTKEECYSFFEDLATVAEIKALAQRLEVARMLEEDVTYSRIAEVTGASSATISRVKRCLNYGADGYKMVLERMEKNKKNKSFQKNEVQ